MKFFSIKHSIYHNVWLSIQSVSLTFFSSLPYVYLFSWPACAASWRIRLSFLILSQSRPPLTFVATFCVQLSSPVIFALSALSSLVNGIVLDHCSIEKMNNYTDLDKEYLETFYAGSRLLEPYCETVGLQIDQVCFAFILSMFTRHFKTFQHILLMLSLRIHSWIFLLHKCWPCYLHMYTEKYSATRSFHTRYDCLALCYLVWLLDFSVTVEIWFICYCLVFSPTSPHCSLHRVMFIRLCW